MYFLSLYWRNVKGVFLGGFVDSVRFSYAAPIIWIAHLALLPLTLTFGAGIKSIVDYFSRFSSFVTAEAIKNKQQAISKMDSIDLSLLTTKLLQYEAQSNSSKKLLEQLNQLPNERRRVIKAGYDECKYNLALDQLGKDAEKKFQPAYIKNLELDSPHQEKLDAYDKANKAHLSTQRQDESKRLITEYIGAEHNNGKKVFQIIFGLFNPLDEKSKSMPKKPKVSGELHPLQLRK